MCQGWIQSADDSMFYFVMVTRIPQEVYKWCGGRQTLRFAFYANKQTDNSTALNWNISISKCYVVQIWETKRQAFHSFRMIRIRELEGVYWCKLRKDFEVLWVESQFGLNIMIWTFFWKCMLHFFNLKNQTTFKERVVGLSQNLLNRTQATTINTTSFHERILIKSGFSKQISTKETLMLIIWLCRSSQLNTHSRLLMLLSHIK